MADQRTRAALPASLVLDPQLAQVVQGCTPAQADALQEALRAAYEAGAADAEQRTGRFVASILQPLMGLPEPAGDTPAQLGAKRRAMLRGAMQVLQGLARR